MYNYTLMLIVCNSLFALLIVHLIFRSLLNGLCQNEEAVKVLVFEEIIKSLAPSKLFDKTLKDIDLSEELGPFLDVRVEEIIRKVALQVPMGEFLLAGALGRKLKEKVKGEIEAALPDIQEHFIQGLSNKIDVEAILREKISKFEVLHLFDEIKKKASNKINRLMWLTAVLGALLGLVEAWLSVLFL